MSKRITIADLEFDQIKQNLKEFLKGQSQFSDYNFEGSNLSILLDVLSYNTHYNAMYTNMALNEAFLDSATKRDSVVSLANALGYVPRSSRAASVVANFTITGVTPDPVSGYPNFITLPRYTEFFGTKDGVRYSFYTKDPITVEKSVVNTYPFTSIELIEGAVLENRFEYTTQNSFAIPNTNIDTTTLQVTVQETPSSSAFTTYNLASSVVDLDGDSLVFFLRELDGLYYISFGDDIIGKQLPLGAIVTLSYFVCSGSEPNGITSISYSGSTLEGGTVTGITLASAVAGGRDIENIEEIRFNAPNMYAAQNRAVTALDYQALILSKVPAAKAVNVWGGENNSPPQYGKVFISVKTESGRALTYNEQQQIIRNVIDPVKVISVIPEFVTPDFIEVELDVVAYYDATLTSDSASTIKTNVTSALLAYDTTELQKFNNVFRSSTITRLIENSHPAVVSSVPRIKIYRTVTPIYNKNNNYNINVGNPFVLGTIKSSGFYIKDNTNLMYIDDDGAGSLVMHTFISGVRSNVSTVGTVDYENGILLINNINIVRIVDTLFTIGITPASPDIASFYNQIVLLNRNLLRVNVIVDETTKGRLLSGGSYTFTKSTL